MAAIISPNKDAGKKKFSFKKKVLNIDLTPMVDLGFILVSFFVFTSAITRQTAMQIVTPNDSERGTNDRICQSCALTFITVQGDSIWYFEGMEAHANYQQCSLSEVRSIIMNKKRALQTQGDNKELQVIIKCASNSEYSDMVNLIDECNISLVKRYYLDELSPGQALRFNGGAVSLPHDQ